MNSLQKLVITENQPTAIVKDFMTYAKYVEDHQILLTKAQRWLPRKDLLAINEQMSEPEQQVTATSDQHAYPLLNLFYHLGLAARLFRTSQQRNSQQALLPTERLTLFYQLTPSEKYITLLETLWVDADWDHLVGEKLRYGPALAVPLIFDLLEQIPPGNTIDASGDTTGILKQLFWWGNFVHYFRYFGFWEMTLDEKTSAARSRYRYQIKTLTPTPMFYLLGTKLVQFRDLSYWNLPLRREAGDWRGIPGEALPADEENWDSEPFIEALIPLFPTGALAQCLPRQTGVFFDGTYVLKIAVRANCWRRLELSSHFTLYHLHETIQRVFDFNDDHLYAFFLDGISWSSKRAFYAPDADDAPLVTEARLGELHLSVGQTFLYLFDFGDEWNFSVTVEDILSVDTENLQPRLIESKGESPAQYGYFI
jgi:hypothetical protein